MARSDAIAIIGMACRFPGAPDIAAFWRNLIGGVESIRVFTEAEAVSAGVDQALRRDALYVGATAALDGIEDFDAAFFGFTPRDAEITDPHQRLFLECAWEALEAGGYLPGAAAGRVGVFGGTGMSTYLIRNLLTRPDVLESVGDLELLMANSKDFVPTRVAYKLNLTGPAININTACSTGLVNVHVACQSLLAFECDMALAGGVAVQVPQDRGYLYQPDGVLSRDGHCRPFDAKASGTVCGNGAGVVLLKRLDEAMRDRDHIHAVIIGSAMNNDGSGKAGFTAPSVTGQATAIRDALAIADVPADSIGCIEAHGTGTAVGDPIEMTALTEAYGERTARRGYCAIGSVKSNFGHLDEAAGVAGLIKAALAIERGLLPPSLNYEAPNPAIDFARSPFFVNAALRDWPEGTDVRRAGVSSFGLGGTNVHAILEQAPAQAQPTLVRAACHLLPLSARTPTAVDAAASRLADALAGPHPPALEDVSYTLLRGRSRFPHRRAVVCRDREEAIALLRGSAPDRLVQSVADADDPRAIIFMFSGQGSHYDGVARGLYAAEPVFREALDRCAASLGDADAVRDAVFGPVGKPMAAIMPAQFAMQYALAQLWMSWGVRPAAMIGHSAGEYVAACLAGVFAVDDALRLLAARGGLVDRTARGAMLVVALPEAEVRRRLPARVEVSAIATPSSCAVSGPKDVIEAFRLALAAEGVDCRAVDIDVAPHSASMEAVLPELYARVSATPRRPPSLPFVSNVTGTWITDAEATSAEYWTAHLREAVRFSPGIEAICARWPRAAFLEIGAGRGLASAVLRHPARRPDQPVVTSLRHGSEDVDDQLFLLTAAARLWGGGVSIDADALLARYEPRRVPLPTYPFERKRFWIDPAPPDALTTRSSKRRASTEDWLYAPSWTRTSPPAPAPRNRRVLILGPAGDLVARLRSHEAAVDDGSALEGEALREALLEADDIVDLRPIAVSEGDAPSAAALFGRLIETAQALGGAHGDKTYTIVTAGVHDVTGAEALAPKQAIALGVVQVLEQEHPQVRCRAIDLERAERSSAETARLVVELQSAITDRIVALRGGHRWARTYVPLTATADRPRLRERGVYLITGGIGDVGLTIARYLARAAQARIVLTSRTRELAETQRERIVAAGGEVLVRHVDVADEAAMRALMRELHDRYDRVDGVIHAAGVTSGDVVFRSIPDTNADQIAALFGPKVDGTLVLARVLADVPLDFCVLVSSNASTLGGLGQSAYSAASHFLDAFAAAERRARRPWTSTNWDGWPSETSGPGHEFSIEAYTLTTAEAEEMFERVLRSDVDRVVVSAGDLKARLASWQQSAQEAPAAPPPAPSFQGSEIERAVASEMSALIGIAVDGPYANFFELGGDSLLGSRLIARLARRFGVTVGVRALFANPTVGGLATRLAESVEQAASGRDGSSITAVAQAASYPLSSAQRRLWVLHRMDPLSAAYHVPLHQLLDGPLDVEALQRSLDALVARHEALRTVFPEIDGEPRQVVNEPRCTLERVDLTGEAEPERAARALALAAATTPFDLANGPLVRATLTRLGPTRHALLFTVHHIIADGVSIGVIAKDLARLYASARADAPPALPPLRIQLRDTTAWQDALIKSEVGAAARRYWHEQLAAPLPVLGLIEDFPRPPVLTSRGRELLFDVSVAHTDALTALARHREASLFAVLVALVKTLLHRHTGDEDLIVGTPSAGRTHADLDDQVGCYLNTLALRTRLSPDLPFTELVDRVRATAAAALDHQHYPFEQLVTELQPTRDTSRSPIFDVMVILQNDVEGALALDGLQARSFLSHNDTAKLDVSFNFKVAGGQLLLGLEYNSDLYSESHARTIGDHLLTLIESVIAEPSGAIGRLPLMSAAERHRVVVDFNATETSYPRDAALIDLFDARVAHAPDETAVRHRGQSITFRALDARARQLAAHFATRGGLGAGDTATLAVGSSIDLPAALLALMKLGVTAVLTEPSTPAARLALLLEDSRSRALIVTSPGETVPFEGTVIDLDREQEVIASAHAAPSAPTRAPDDQVLIFFTSGSTGRPKGVAMTNRAIVNELDWFRRYFDVGPTDVLPQKTVVSFVDSIVELLLPLTVGGGVLALRPHDDVSRDLAAMATWFRDLRPTIVQFVPAVFEELVAEHGIAPLQHLRALILSGGPAGHQPAYPFRVYNLYGCSEGTALSTAFDMTGAAALARVPIGRPLQNTSVYILDESLSPLPMTVPGEICIGGDMVASGYLGRPDLTAERFVENPFRPGERLFRSGDFGRWLADGQIDYLGRRDGQIKIRGVRIECGEIEHALRSHPAVRDAVAVAPATAGREPVLTAYLICREPAPSIAELRTHLTRTLPDAMVPSAMVFVDEFPRTSSGKIDRRRLPAPEAEMTAAPRVAPRDQWEASIAAIWQDVLGLPSIGVHDDFLALGGHSLKAASVASRIERDLGCSLSLVDVFRHPTVALLSEIARERPRTASEPILTDTDDEIAPLTPGELDVLR